MMNAHQQWCSKRGRRRARLYPLVIVLAAMGFLYVCAMVGLN